jgi:hypothetical protein
MTMTMLLVVELEHDKGDDGRGLHHVLKPAGIEEFYLCRFMNLNAKPVEKPLIIWLPTCTWRPKRPPVRIANPKTPCAKCLFLPLPMPNQADPHLNPAAAEAVAAVVAGAVQTDLKTKPQARRLIIRNDSLPLPAWQRDIVY